MRVLLTHERFPPAFGGGGEVAVLETAKGLIRSGVDLKVLVGGDPRITSYEGVPTRRIALRPYLFGLALGSIVKHARDVDLIQTFTYYAALPSLVAGRLLGKPVVLFVLGIFGETWKKVRSPFEARLRIAWEKCLMSRHYSHVVVPSNATRDLAISLGADPARLSVSHPGLDPAHRPRPKEDFVFFTGKADRRKGTEELLFVARALPHVRFRAMVWGPERESLLRNAPPNINFPPFERGEKLFREFGSARIFFFPSFSEAFGLAAAEAMASGCALVASGDLPFEGLRIQPGDRAGMIAAIDRLWTDPDLCAQMGAANVEAARQFNWEAYIQRLRAVYRSVLDC